MMRKTIIQHIKQLEAEKDIKVLLACETGSRAWGFPSPDSDYDIRMIYVHRQDWYLSIRDKKDSIEYMSEDRLIDISGWELRKSLQLLQKSNAALLERIQSPIIYVQDEAFVQEFLALSQQQYSRIRTIHHYLSMTKKIYEELKSNESYKLKRFFYVLRAALVCKWILEKEVLPPIDFRVVYQNLDLEPALVQRIAALIDFKKTVDESYRHQGETPLLELIQTCIHQSEAAKQLLPSGTGQLEELADLFRKYIKKYDRRGT
jgi:predicted nucleotidyltransferase